MTSIYDLIVASKLANKKLLAILLDPDKLNLKSISRIAKAINLSPATHIFVGGSTNSKTSLDAILINLKKYSALPIVLFPGNPSQISNHAHGILFLSLISGRNSDYLIEHHVNAVPILKKTQLEIIPTGYILVDSESETAVAKVSKTKPLNRNNHQYILQTAQAGEFLGNKLMYLEAGSGAKLSVPIEVIQLVSKNLTIPIIVGGGIRTMQEIQNAYRFGADLVVIGTAFENDLNFFNP